ncbi:hypothetical protein B0H15DRAFT_8026 [Mycena belliarum]|uniref:P-loop containing nucleoside triphosphate hydrolase protein n=1 Tax=Mycena belliarum TaxID=1033014 RepID=A0AAD6XY53_9AGAR|nr:hypothetical protein B0H15DRAFT_8026 [Mycena belliae]
MPDGVPATFTTRGYQQEMLEESLKRNIIIALDTGSGKTHIAVLRMKLEAEREPKKISWFLAPTVALCQQQRAVISSAIPVSVGLISGSIVPEQWKDAALWRSVLNTHRIMVTTPQVLLDALHHGFISLGTDIGLLIFDEAHHAVRDHPYNMIMAGFYFGCPARELDEAGFPSSAGDNVRPMILGLTASPIYGGNVVTAFRTIETNLDSTIRAPRRQREELAKFVHRPVFKHVLFKPDPEPFSTNLAAFHYVLQSLDIDTDPYVVSLRKKLAKITPNTVEYTRVDQQLSATILKQNTYTFTALRAVSSAASAICSDIGPWAADWYIWRAIDQAKMAATAFEGAVSDLKNTEKGYLLKILDQIIVSPVSYLADDMVDELSDKLRVLVERLLAEKAETEADNELYSGLVFVQRRDSVLALVEVLSHHPATKNVFKVGSLVGGAESVYKAHSVLDITRGLHNTQDSTMNDFKTGEKNLIISTAVAEEGIDIQACGSVIRWDPPPNMASWAQSRGRARRERSTFTLMFENDDAHVKTVKDWEKLEHDMVALYNDPSRDFKLALEEEPFDDEIDGPVFRVETTGALLTLHSAVSHLHHFCAVIPNTGHVDYRPIFDIDPPELPEGWHSFEDRSTAIKPYLGPYGAKVTLPRLLPSTLRYFETDRVHRTKTSAYRHAAFYAYRALYENGLLNDHLLPLSSVVEPQLEEEVKAILAEVEKRAGTARVSVQMNPWAPTDTSDVWYTSDLAIAGLPPLLLFTRTKPPSWSGKDAPILHRPGSQDSVSLQPSLVEALPQTIARAREYTRRLFWSINGPRMAWEDLDFSYLFLPVDDSLDAAWNARRLWHAQHNPGGDQLSTNALPFGREFSYPGDLGMVRNGPQFNKAFKFVRWRFEALSEEEETDMRALYCRHPDLEISYPVIAVENLPPRTNFLVPIPEKTGPAAPTKTLHLLPRLSYVTLCSEAEVQYAFLLPSVLRSLAVSMTVNSMRGALLSDLGLASLPQQLLTTALCAPVSQERSNYQRLETLGDTVLKFMSTIQLLGEYPLWHEGYLTKKMGHCVSNVRLAKANVQHGLYRWIIRDRMLGKKWKPSYFTTSDTQETTDVVDTDAEMDDVNLKKKKKSKRQDLSTKVLADVIESLIGAVYLHGSFDLAFVCARFFDLGIKWEPLPVRIVSMLNRLETHSELPSQLDAVEQMLGYTFTHKLLLVEALTHASYQQDLRTISYERLEFCGDAVLDMIVTDYLYRAEGKEYSPGHMFHRKSAMVNANILAFFCLAMHIDVTTSMPGPVGGVRGARSPRNVQVELHTHTQQIYLWQCLLHSSSRVLDEQHTSFARFGERRAEIEEALQKGSIFPWAALTRLQAPKFLSDMVESVLGAVFLDARGDLDAVRGVLRQLGLLQVLERVVHADVDVLHPVSRLHLWASKRGAELGYAFAQEGGMISCTITVDGAEVEGSRVADQYKGRLTKNEVQLAAAEKAIAFFQLRDVNTNYALLKRKASIKSKKRKRASSTVTAAVRSKRAPDGTVSA